MYKTRTCNCLRTTVPITFVYESNGNISAHCSRTIFKTIFFYSTVKFQFPLQALRCEFGLRILIIAYLTISAIKTFIHFGYFIERKDSDLAQMSSSVTFTKLFSNSVTTVEETKYDVAVVTLINVIEIPKSKKKIKMKKKNMSASV